MIKFSFTSPIRLILLLSALSAPLLVMGCSKAQQVKSTSEEVKAFQGDPQKIAEAQARAQGQAQAAQQAAQNAATRQGQPPR